MNREPWFDQVDKILADARIEGTGEWVPISHGGNNRVFRLDLPGRSLLVKKYFRHPDDRRDRLGTEYTFTVYAWEHGVRAVPEPVGCYHEGGIGVYEFIVGRKPSSDDVDQGTADQAGQFSFDLSRNRAESGAQALPAASEACFSVVEHLACVDRRIERLQSMQVDAAADREASSFVAQRLAPAWSKIRQRIMDRSSAAGQSLDMEDRCLSPSDLGFHNTLLTSDRVLRFFDFEYAGWDDPAKLICDFFCQPQVRVPMKFFDAFAERVSSIARSAEECMARARLLLPAYQVKWCCIMMNEYLPAGRDRRSFAGHAAECEDYKRSQLEKAIRALNLIGKD